MKTRKQNKTNSKTVAAETTGSELKNRTEQLSETETTKTSETETASEATQETGSVNAPVKPYVNFAERDFNRKLSVEKVLEKLERWMRRAQVFEHGSLAVGEQGLTVDHFNALVCYNERHGCDFFRVGHNRLHFGSFVGVIQVGRLAIEILPKTEKAATADKGEWQGVLLEMLRQSGLLEVEGAPDRHGSGRAFRFSQERSNSLRIRQLGHRGPRRKSRLRIPGPPVRARARLNRSRIGFIFTLYTPVPISSTNSDAGMSLSGKFSIAFLNQDTVGENLVKRLSGIVLFIVPISLVR
jgi:hypothetical protein